jgi:hypothetical protein
MAGLVTAIHVLPAIKNSWMPGTGPGMTLILLKDSGK